MAVIPSEGTLIGIGSTSSSFTSIAQVLSITPPSMAVPEVETTVLTDTAKAFRPGVIPGPHEAGFRILYDPDISTAIAGHQALRDLMTTPAIKYFQITYNTTLATDAKDVFGGFITGWEPADLEDETNMEVDITIRITGAVTDTAGT